MPPLGPVGYALVGYFALLVALSFVRRREVRSPLLQRLRAFFPSWRFFDQVGEVPLLWMRVGPADGQLGPWQPALTEVRRSWRALLFNPEGNLRLACGSLLEQLLSELASMPDDAGDAELEDVVSYRLTRNLVVDRLAGSGQVLPGAHYQFKLATLMQGAPLDSAEDVLISAVYRI